jgi:hypothetical protein
VTGKNGVVTGVKKDFLVVGTVEPYDTTDAGTGTITARGENGINEGGAKAFDNDTETKWLDFANSDPTTRASWIQYQYPNEERFVVSSYAVTSANDTSTRDPRDWVFRGSDDGVNWTDLDVQTNRVFSNRFERQTYPINNSTPYEYYRFEITSVFAPGVAVAVQLSELEFIGLPEDSFNPQRNFLDVNGDNKVSASDAFVIINWLSRNPVDIQTNEPPITAQPGTVFNVMDTNRDGRITAIDALIIVNWLSRNPIADASLAASSVDAAISADDDEEESLVDRISSLF